MKNYILYHWLLVDTTKHKRTKPEVSYRKKLPCAFIRKTSYHLMIARLSMILNSIGMLPNDQKGSSEGLLDKIALMEKALIIRLMIKGFSISVGCRIQSLHLICGIMLGQNCHDGPQFHPPLRLRGGS